MGSYMQQGIPYGPQQSTNWGLIILGFMLFAACVYAVIYFTSTPTPVVTADISGNNGGVTCNQFCSGTWGRDQLKATHPTFTGASKFLLDKPTGAAGICTCVLSNDSQYTWPA